ncbi:MAG TPA: DUF167 family protein [Candidatus Norongarragalinales archaeon]|nr:DUF167 family protein [Candidatus Norongarragalinales archaeon]
MIIRVVPSARKFGIAFRDGKVVVRVRGAARENAANIELLAELRKLTGKKVHLLRGSRAREKEIAFENLGDEDAVKLLEKSFD